MKLRFSFLNYYWIMSDLNYIKSMKFEKLFEMESWYVLNFSNNTFKKFVASSINIDIYEKYPGLSKANILRNIFRDFSNGIVWKLLLDLLDYYEVDYTDDMNNNVLLFNQCKEIALNIKNNLSIKDIEINEWNENFEILIEEIKNASNRDKPENWVDRLHTLMVKFVKILLTKHNIEYSHKDSLNANFWKYVNFLYNERIIDSEITKNILKHNISILEKFNSVRNNRSLAHDNILLTKIEAQYILNNIIELVNFISSIEKLNNKKTDYNCF